MSKPSTCVGPTLSGAGDPPVPPKNTIGAVVTALLRLGAPTSILQLKSCNGSVTGLSVSPRRPYPLNNCAAPPEPTFEPPSNTQSVKVALVLVTLVATPKT